MGLSSALNTASSIFSNTSAQMAVVSKNISNSGNADYSRRDATLTTSINGAKLNPTTRSEDALLQRHNLTAMSALSAQGVVSDGLDQLQAAMGGNGYATSPSTFISKLESSLQAFAASPGNTTLAQSVVSDAKDVANSLNQASDAVQTLRRESDENIQQQVTSLRDLLNQFQTVNDAVKTGTASNRDVNDELDKRDQILGKISQIVGVQTVIRDNNDMAIYTSDGTTLFEAKPRDILYSSQPGYDATTTGNAVYIDGVPLKPGTGGNTSAMGSLQANLQIRDTIAPKFQAQLDEISRGLVTQFAEKDQTGSGLPNMPGLFTWTGGNVPGSGTVQPGMSSSIAVNAAVDVSQGGDAALLRDGGINGASYVSNTTGAAGYSTLLQGYVTGLTAKIPFDPSTDLNSSLSISDYSSSSIGWLEEYRSQASDSKDTKKAAASTAAQALSSVTGVSLDEELSKLLDLEQSYKASTKIVSTVNDMLQSLMAAVR
ncbi:MAG TPA: flagellar hook-associated protein FlgK [Ensifer sp.]|nr:flagellar hook-associated protein FlgK [Ensifer sp.]